MAFVWGAVIFGIRAKWLEKLLSIQVSSLHKHEICRNQSTSVLLLIDSSSTSRHVNVQVLTIVLLNKGSLSYSQSSLLEVETLDVIIVAALNFAVYKETNSLSLIKPHF